MNTRLLLLVIPLLFSACTEKAGNETRRAERDPAVVGALADPIMADPDLTSQNRGNSVLQGGGPASAELPPDKSGPEEADKARAAALALVGGRLAALPVPAAPLAASRLSGKLTAQAFAEALPELSQGCAARLEYGFIWAARMPAALPLYPRGHARQAAGSDDGTCRLRVVAYVTPVPANEVLAFHATTAGKAGLALAFRKEGGDAVLTGTGKALSFACFARAFDSDLTEVVLVTRER